MEIGEVTNVLFNYGIAGIVLAYALWKDKTFTDKMIATMTTLTIGIEDIKKMLDDVLKKEDD